MKNTTRPNYQAQPHEHRRRSVSWLRKAAGTLILLPLLLLLGALALGFLGRYKVISSSMYPTLHTGDFVLAEQDKQYAPQRGDIVVFADPEDFTAYSLKDRSRLTKRVAAMPGDRIALEEKGLRINGRELHQIPRWKLDRALYPKESVMLAKDEYFLLGDNQDNSYDSMQFGPVSREMILGRVLVVYWPIHHAGVPDSIQELRAKELQWRREIDAIKGEGKKPDGRPDETED